MANVMFKRGLAAQLPASTSAADGVFYLTTDTHRLYVGQDNNLVELNKSIEVVDVIKNPSSGQTALPTTGVSVGQFYYVKGTNNHNGATDGNGNILCVVESINNGVPNWVQVNPDTDTKDNTETFISSATATLVSADNSEIKYNLTINQTRTNRYVTDSVLSTTAISTTLAIPSSAVNALVTDAAVGIISSTSSNGAVTLSTTGNGSTSANKVVISKGDNINITGSGNNFTISAVDTQYEIKSPAVSGATAATSAAINLNIKGGAEQGGGSINVKAGNGLSINNTTASEFTVYHKASAVTTGTYGTNSNTNPSAGGNISIPKLTIDSMGHITSASNQTITLPSDVYTTAVAANNNGQIVVTRSDGQEVSSTTALYYTITQYTGLNSSTQVTVVNQEDLGTYYTKSAIDNIINGINGMTYKGTVASAAAIPTSGVKVGDTYVVSAAFGDYEQGNIIIAKGTETNGVITSNLSWDLIDTNYEHDTTYAFNVASQEVKVTPTVGASQGSPATVVKFNGDDTIKLSTSSTNSTITISHTASGVVSGSATSTSAGAVSTTAPGYGGTFKVPQITVNKYGHVTKLEDRTITLPASINTTYSVGVTSGSTVLNLNADGGDDSSITFSASTAINVIGKTNEIVVQHAKVTSATANSTTAVSHGGTIAAISGITINEQGHITNTTYTNYTLPSDNNTTYTVSTTNNNVIWLNAGGAGGGDSSHIAINSSSLSVSTSSTTALNIDLVWGSF